MTFSTTVDQRVRLQHVTEQYSTGEWWSDEALELLTSLEQRSVEQAG